MKKLHDDLAGKETCDSGVVVSVQAMERRPREMAKTLGQTKVGGNITRAFVGGGEMGAGKRVELDN